MKSDVSAHDLRVLLRKRFCPPEWAFMEEVRNRTGGFGERYADAVAMNLWPSRGMAVIGFEIKVRRGDWLQELRNPNKSAPVQKYCDHWWIIAPDTNVVPVEELPETWGLMVKQGTKLYTKKSAPKLEAQKLDRFFIASMLRRANEAIVQATEGKSGEHYQRGFAEGKDQAESMRGYELHRAKVDVENTQKEIKDFEEASGVLIQRWRGKEIGEAVRLVLEHIRHGGRRIAFKQAIDAFEQQLKAMKVMEQCLDALDEQQDMAAGDPPHR